MSAPGGQARSVALLVRLTLRRIFRSPTYVFSMVLLPFLAVLMVGVTVGPGTRPLAVGLVGGTEGTVGPRVRALLAQDRSVDVRSYGREADLRAAIQRGDVLAGLVLPAGAPMSVASAPVASVASAPVASVAVLVDPSRPAGAAARLALVAAADRVGAVVEAARFASEQAGVPFDTALATAERVSARQRQVQVAAAYPAGTEQRGEYDYGVVGVLVLFMFVTAVSGSALIVDSRQRGLVGRLLATELRPGSFVVAEILGRYLVTLGQAAVVLVGGAVLFGVDWGPPLWVAAVVGTFALVASAAGILVGVSARTFVQAIVFGTVGAIALAMLGGCMWPLELAPPGLRGVARLTPHHWAMDGLLSLVNRTAPVPGVGLSLLVLGGFAAAGGTVATARLRKVAMA